MFGGLGIWELLAIFMIVLLLFGARRLPEIGWSLWKGIREFKGSIREVEGEINREISSPHETPGTPEASKAAAEEANS